jgi:hypothetical protein
MKYQVTCPNCHYEWHYDNGYYDDNITRLGIEIQDIIMQLRTHKLLPKSEQYAKTDWWLSAKRALTEKQKQLAELKAIRKQYDQQIKQYEYQVFKNLVKDLVGETKYKELLEQMETELEAYQTSGLMRHEYTRSNSKSSVTSINKL